MKKLIGIFLIFFALQNAFGQSGWVNENSILSVSNIKFLNQFTGYGFGYNLAYDGFIYKTTNSGINWIKIPCALKPYNVGSLGVADSDNIFLGANNGLYKSSNGGINWFLVSNTPSSTYINYINFVNSSTGFYRDYSNMYKTTNGGLNWSVNFPIQEQGTIFEVTFQFPQLGFATARIDSTFKILKTTNYGVNWVTVFNYNFEMSSIRFVDSLTGYALGNKYIIKTTNKGESWSSKESVPNYTGNGLIDFISNGVIIYCKSIYGDSPVYKTTNDGLTWDSVYTIGGIYSLHFANATTGFICNYGGSVFKSTNAGSNWKCESSALNVASSLTAINFPNEVTGYAVGEKGLILKTTNTGTSWSVSYLNNINLTNVFFLNSDTGFIVPLTKDLYRTTNGGVNWDTMTSNTQFGEYKSIDFINYNTGFVSRGGILLKTTNAGLNWTPQQFDFMDIWSIQFVDSVNGFLCGSFSQSSYNYGKIYKTTNGGENWTMMFSMYDFWFYDLKMYSKNVGFLASTQGIYKYNYPTNPSWVQMSSLSRICIEIGDVNNIYVSGYKSTNSGNNWYTQYIAPNSSIKDIEFVNANTGFMVGGSGNTLIYKTTDGGGVISAVFNTGTITYDKYSLSQNYPNPFNPSTVIRYQLSAAGFTTLKVFDLLGKEVAQLVNEKQNAGRYAVDFNSAEFNLPSGIYFYTLKAGEFKETRKMVLIK